MKLNLVVPILFFVIMILSVFWTTDKLATIKAISKEIYFLIIPILFLLKSKKTIFYKSLFYKLFGVLITIVALFYLIKGFKNYVLTSDITYLFYHDVLYDGRGLVPYKINAIYLSWFTLIAIFSLIKSKFSNSIKVIMIGVLVLFLFLLSSKNVIFVFSLLSALYIFYNYRFKLNIKGLLYILPFIIIGFFAFKNVTNRYKNEFENAFKTNFYYENGVRHVGFKSIFNPNEVYTPNDYFSGLIFRIYQFSSFKKIVLDNNKYLGVGLNAVQPEIVKVMEQDNLNPGYYTMNFHNQYLQITAELGLIGLLVMLWMMIELFYIAIRDRNFLAFCFTVSSFSLFLTESIFSRQRGILFFVLMYCLITYAKKNKLKN